MLVFATIKIFFLYFKKHYPSISSRVFMGDKTYVPSAAFTHVVLVKTTSGINIRNYE